MKLIQPSFTHFGPYFLGSLKRNYTFLNVERPMIQTDFPNFDVKIRRDKEYIRIILICQAFSNYLHKLYVPVIYSSSTHQ